MTDPVPVTLTPAREGIATLMLDRPQRRNALTRAMWGAIPGLLEQAAADPAVKVLLVRGAGGCFAAGADIAEFRTALADRAGAEAYAGDIARAMDGLADFPKPTLALIEGACVGGGMGLALACDLRFAAEDARLGITPARLGLLYPLGDTRRLVEAVGAATAKDLLFTGRLLGAAEALALRLVDRVQPRAALEAAVLAYAAEITAASQWTVRQTKAMIRRIQAGQRHDDAETLAMFLDTVEGPDFQEGWHAFLDKRPPRFPFV